MPSQPPEPLTSSRHAYPRFSLRRLLLALTLLAIVFAAARYLVEKVSAAREAALGSVCSGRFCQLTVALHNYHDVYGSFPPAIVHDSQGRPMHSWRMLLTPYLNGDSWANAYDYTRPWNHPANLRIEKNGERLFQCPSAPDGMRFTNYVLVTGPNTLFPPDRCTTFKDAEGRDDAIWLVEIANSDIHWMEPRDLDIRSMSFQVNDPNQPSIGSHHPGYARVGVISGSCGGVRVDNNTPPAKIKSMLLIRPR